MSDEEYEVENVVQARVSNLGRGKKAKKSWEYLVKWKGYDSKDNTWEPPENFNTGSEILDSFWTRAHPNLKGRDKDNIKSFQLGEEIFPVGPPRKPRKTGVSEPETTSSSQNAPSSSRKSPRRRVSSPIEILPTPERQSTRQPSSKRGRVSPLVEPSLDRQTLKQSSKRRRVSPDIIDITESDSARPTKRKKTDPKPPPTPSVKKPLPDDFRRAQAQPPLPKARPKAAPEIVPDSDEENVRDDDAVMADATISQNDTLPSTASSGNVPSSTLDAPSDDKDLDKLQQDKTAKRPITPPLPFHRQREANPRVNMVDVFTPTSLGTGISAKSRAVSNNPVSKRSKPGPGRSSQGFSLLTYDRKAPANSEDLAVDKGEKGRLVTLKGVYKKHVEEGRSPSPIDNDEPNDLFDVPTGPELLQLAGVKEHDNALDDFDEDLAEPIDPQPSTSNRLLAAVKDKLFPSGSSSGNETPATSIWSRSIFGPLGLGSDSRRHTEKAQDSDSTPFTLNVSASSSIPAAFVDILDRSSLRLKEVVKNCDNLKGRIGSFYGGETAFAIFDTFRTCGSCARVVCSPNAVQEEQDQFTAFRKRLDLGDLFVTMAGPELLALCSSENAMLFARFNLPQELVNIRDSIVVAVVKIEQPAQYRQLVMNK